MADLHRRLLRKLRQRAGVRLFVRREGDVWCVRENINLGNHVQLPVRTVARATSRRGALDLAAQRIGGRRG